MFKIAGCEFGDIESMVNKDGIEATLYKLLSEGVYISWEEFKGKKDVVRSGTHIYLKERDFDNPFLSVYYQTQSTGTRSAGTRTTFDLNYHLERNYYRLPMLAVNNALDVPIGLWKPVLPAKSGISNVLRQWKVGKPVARWFSPVDERQLHTSLQQKLALRYILYAGRLWGAKLARPEYVSLEEADKVSQWMATTRKQYGGCSLITSVSPAVRVCQAAMEKGHDIKGTHFIVSGEPLTEAKRQHIEATGATVVPRYSVSEIGRIGCGCPEGGYTDDVHLLHDSVALIQHRRKLEHAYIYVNAFLFTTLLPSTPMILLNLESDDYGVVETRSCPCLFGQLGFEQHLHNIRSFAKLTGSGVTIAGSDFVRILEEVLPRKYGGGPTDYQLLEEEDSMGQTHLSLIISPAVGTLDENEVREIVLSSLRKSAYGGKLAAGFWSQVNTLEIKRMYPVSLFGKVTTLHLTKSK